MKPPPPLPSSMTGHGGGVGTGGRGCAAWLAAWPGRYRFAFKEDLIEGRSEVVGRHQLNTNSGGGLLVVQHDDDYDDNAQRESSSALFVA